MSSSSPSSRRAFLRTLGQLGLLGGPGLTMLVGLLVVLGAMAAQSSSAAQLDRPYRALVCLFMNGGNDAHNWLVPLDSAEHAADTRARGDLALPASALAAVSWAALAENCFRYPSAARAAEGTKLENT